MRGRDVARCGKGKVACVTRSETNKSGGVCTEPAPVICTTMASRAAGGWGQRATARAFNGTAEKKPPWAERSAGSHVP